MGDKISEFFNIFVGLRKTIAWFSLIAIAVIFRLKGYINGAQFVDLSKGTFLGFVAGNMSEHVATTVKEFLNSKGQKVKQVDTSIQDGSNTENS